MRSVFKEALVYKLVIGVSLMSMASIMSSALAQEADEATDEVVVTGIRQSLESSLEIKRNSKGIVESITAEDMGKFPDSNLAESLQRITGVSIDRDQTSGEGKTVTVRGFGADFNLVTFNGRSMPSSTLGNFASAPDTRSFDFGNLAPEAVSRVDIFKTAKAKTASGGMGSTIDIRTTRPLDMPGFTATVGVKQVDDTSHNGTPNSEVSALVYNTFLDDRIGLALTAVEQSNSHSVASFRHGWSGFERFGDAQNQTLANDELGLTAGDVVNNGNNLSNSSLHSVLAGSTGYYIDDLEQTRKNYQITFQARPMDNLTLTWDRTIANLEHEVNSRSLSINYGDSDQSYFGLTTQYVDGPIASPTSLHFIYPEGGYMDRNDPTQTRRGIMPLNNMIGYQNNMTELDGQGFNVEWDVSERLFLSLDYHNSTSESKPLSPFGSNAFINSDSRSHTEVSIDYTSELPVISLEGVDTFVEAMNDNPGSVCTDGNGGPVVAGCVVGRSHPGYDEMGQLAPQSRILSGAGNVRSDMKNEIEQLQLNGSFELAGTVVEDFVDTLEFGLSSQKTAVRSRFGEQLTPNWNGVLPPDYNQFDATNDRKNWYEWAVPYPTELFLNTEPLQPYFAGLDGSGDIPTHIINADYETWFGAYQALWAMAESDWRYDGGDRTAPICGDNSKQGCAEIPFTTNRNLEEKTDSAFVQGRKDFVIRDRDASLTFGLRFEETSITSINTVPQYSGTMWSGADIVTAIPTGSSVLTVEEHDYSHVLPSIDFDVNLEEDLKFRASYSKTIARPLYSQLSGGTVVNPTLSGYSKQNPGGFTGGAGEGDPTLDPYESHNFDFSAEWYYGDISYLSVGQFSKRVTNWIGNATRQDSVQGIRHVGFDTNGDAVAASHGDVSDGTNELAIFNIGYPTQTDQVETVHGIEFAVQHDLGEVNPFPIDLTGFGFILNATFVNSDAEYNDLLPNSIDDRQFAIIGISDSYNAVAYYDHDGLSVRVAYNWRDRFLNFSGMSSGYTEEYDQVDANISYSIPGTPLTVHYDGINLTGEGRQTFERNTPAYKTWVSGGHAKHYVGLRWKY